MDTIDREALVEGRAIRTSNGYRTRRPHAGRPSRGHGKDRLVDIGAKLKDKPKPPPPLPDFLRNYIESVKKAKAAAKPNTKSR